MNQEELKILLKDLQAIPKECEWVEFKLNNGNPEEIGEYISALSNSACYDNQDYAYLVYGIEDKTHRLVGTDFYPLSKKVKGQELENWIATQLTPRIDFNIYELENDDLHFAIFRIDATRNTPLKFKGEAYIRVGSYKKKLIDHPEKERKIWNKGNASVFEKEIAISNVSADKIIDLIDCVSYFELTKIPLPDKKGIIERLVQDKIITRQNSRFSITNLGAILFAKDLELFDELARKAVRVIVYDGNNRIKTQKERSGKRGYAIGFEGLVKYITDLLPSNEVIDRALRKRVSMYPAIAIRELVANALIHQDFSIKGSSPMIEVFDDRIEITNPGKPLIDTLRFVDHSPESRNEILARFMRRVNICEERGSGIDKVVFECEFNQLPAPNFIVSENYTRVVLYAHKTYREMDKQDKIRACYLHACLKSVSGSYMTNQSLRERFAIEEKNYSMVSRVISDAIDVKLIKDQDPENTSRKFAKYVPYWV
ncbi:MAG: ATP-binding protein [Flavobacteriales bacterium]